MFSARGQRSTDLKEEEIEMSIHGKIKEDSILALKARLVEKREMLSFVLSELNRVAKEEKLDLLSDERTIGVLRKSVKQRKETLEASRLAGREDLASQAETEISLISTYLPVGPSEEELGGLAKEIIAVLGASSMKDMGKIMSEIAKRYPSIDKAQASSIVKTLLSR